MKKLLILTTLISALCSASLLAEVAPAQPPESGSTREAPQLLAPHELGVGRLVSDLEIIPVTGKKFRLSELKPAQTTVIAFLSTSCPVSKRFAPTLAALERHYSTNAVRFVFVDPIAADISKDILDAIRTHGFKGIFTRDPGSQIRNALGARSTTEVFVLDAARTLVYRGAVDDQYGLAYSLDAPRQRFLADALVALHAGKTPRVRATTAPGCVLEKISTSSTALPIAYHNRISRIFQQHCLECHHAGGVAPFSLETYNDVVSHAGMIRKVLDQNIMPPWFAAPMGTNHGKLWANDRTLPSEDKGDLLSWLAAGKKEGNPADAPVARVFPKEWNIGTPDTIVQIPKPIEVKATGTMPYQNVYVETGFSEDRWVQALEVRPTAREVVHHVLVFVVTKETDASGKSRNRREGEGGNFFAAYVPGNSVHEFPPGFAKMLPAGASLQFQIHYTPNGTATSDQMRLGLVFAKEPPRNEVRVAGIANPSLRIPPGAENHELHATLPVMFEARLLSFMPHMHVRGKAFRYELALPDGSKKLLLDVPRYDFNWQLQYRLAEPIEVPAGSKLLATAWYDNSTNNPANPDPTREVKWGQQTYEEMLIGYLEYYVPSQKPGEKLSIAKLATRDGTLLFNALDRNQDGKISSAESPTPEAFRLADEDADGAVTLEELKKFMQRRR